MFYPDADDPCGQPSLPYQPYRGHAHSLLSQQQECVSRPATSRAGSSQSGPARSLQAPSGSPDLSKAEALAFVSQCKRWLVAGSLVAFGILSGLVAGHVTGTTSSQATSANQAAPTSNAPATSSSSDGGFFQQQQGGYGFGNGNSRQPPVSSSHTS